MWIPFISFVWSFGQEVTHQIFSYQKYRMLHPQLTGEAPETNEKIFSHLLEALFTSQQMLEKMTEEAKLGFTKFGSRRIIVLMLL